MAVMLNRYVISKPKTAEETQREVDALTHTEFMLRVANMMSCAALYGVAPYYFGGTLTPNGVMLRAMVRRLARINSDIELAKLYEKDFAEKDAEQQRQAKEAAAATPLLPSTVWIDAFSYRQLAQENSISKCYLSTYPTVGSIPLRTLTAEELEAHKTTEL